MQIDNYSSKTLTRSHLEYGLLQKYTKWERNSVVIKICCLMHIIYITRSPRSRNQRWRWNFQRTITSMLLNKQNYVIIIIINNINNYMHAYLHLFFFCVVLSIKQLKYVGWTYEVGYIEWIAILFAIINCYFILVNLFNCSFALRFIIMFSFFIVIYQ